MSDTVAGYKQRRIDPIELGLSAVALDAQKTSNTIDCRGMSQLSVQIVLTRVAATRVDVNIDTSLDASGPTNWSQTVTESIAAGAATLSEYDTQNDVSGGSENWIIDLPINRTYARIRISSTAGGTTDLATVSVLLGAM